MNSVMQHWAAPTGAPDRPMGVVSVQGRGREGHGASAGRSTLRARFKGAAEDAVAAAGVHRLARWVRGRRALVLAYHNVVPDDQAGRGDTSLHLPLSRFKRQLDLIRQECEPVLLTDILAGTWTSRSGRLPLAITFDDAYRGTLELALPELAARNLTGTVFVAPALLGDRTLWWDGLAASLGRDEQPALRAEMMEAGGRLEQAKRAASARGAAWQEMPPLLRTCTEPELLTVVERGMCTVASHTWSHASLPTLGRDELSDELARSRSWLRGRFGDAYVDMVSYPYGHWSPAVEAAAEACGYAGGLALTRGSIRARGTAGHFRLPRMNVPAGLSENGMRIRMGWR